MELHVRDRRCVTILLPPGTDVSSGCARLLVRYAQRLCGAPPWGGIRVEEFRSGPDTETLIIARPAVMQTVSVADYALPFVHKYFMD